MALPCTDTDTSEDSHSPDECSRLVVMVTTFASVPMVCTSDRPCSARGLRMAFRTAASDAYPLLKWLLRLSKVGFDSCRLALASAVASAPMVGDWFICLLCSARVAAPGPRNLRGRVQYTPPHHGVKGRIRTTVRACGP